MWENTYLVVQQILEKAKPYRHIEPLPCETEDCECKLLVVGKTDDEKSWVHQCPACFVVKVGDDVK